MAVGLRVVFGLLQLPAARASRAARHPARPARPARAARHPRGGPPEGEAQAARPARAARRAALMGALGSAGEQHAACTHRARAREPPALHAFLLPAAPAGRQLLLVLHRSAQSHGLFVHQWHLLVRDSGLASRTEF